MDYFLVGLISSLIAIPICVSDTFGVLPLVTGVYSKGKTCVKFVYDKTLQFNELRKAVELTDKMNNKSSTMEGVESGPSNNTEGVGSIGHKISTIFSSIYKSGYILYKTAKNMAIHHFYGAKHISSIYGIPDKSPQSKVYKNLSYVDFYHNNRWYKFPITLKRGPKKYINIAQDVDGEGKVTRDVTRFIESLAGPNVDFYGYDTLHPRDIGIEKLCMIIDGESKIFQPDDVIIM